MIVILSMIAFLIVFLLGWWAFRLAESKGRNPHFWMIATVIFGIPILILLLLPAKTS
ncbi:MAG: hypothetical protein AAGA73_03050 [Pseudomonadota bacterium]